MATVTKATEIVIVTGTKTKRNTFTKNIKKYNVQCRRIGGANYVTSLLVQ